MLPPFLLTRAKRRSGLQILTYRCYRLCHYREMKRQTKSPRLKELRSYYYMHAQQSSAERLCLFHLDTDHVGIPFQQCIGIEVMEMMRREEKAGLQLFAHPCRAGHSAG